MNKLTFKEYRKIENRISFKNWFDVLSIVFFILGWIFFDTGMCAFDSELNVGFPIGSVVVAFFIFMVISFICLYASNYFRYRYDIFLFEEIQKQKEQNNKDTD